MSKMICNKFVFTAAFKRTCNRTGKEMHKEKHTCLVCVEESLGPRLCSTWGGEEEGGGIRGNWSDVGHPLWMGYALRAILSTRCACEPRGFGRENRTGFFVRKGKAIAIRANVEPDPANRPKKCANFRNFRVFV